ncbi:MAG: urease accessory protein UreD [Pseudomonadota bacterium]
MFAADLQSDVAERRQDRPLQRIRVDGGVALRFAVRAGKTRVTTNRQSDGYKVRFPKRAAVSEAVVINTGGGLVGGDRVHVVAELDAAATACLTTPAAERVYRAVEGSDAARVDVRVSLSDRAELAWLPQETIAFNGARMRRAIDVEMAGTACLVAAETLIFGRAAMGETLSSGFVCDQWRIRRDGRLVFAESMRLDGEVRAALDSCAGANGGAVVATVVAVSPEAEDRLSAIRTAIGEFDTFAAASAWNGLLVVRAVAPNANVVRSVLEKTLPILTRHPLPRVWAN